MLRDSEHIYVNRINIVYRQALNVMWRLLEEYSESAVKIYFSS
jgi:hypothetical protein